VSHNTSGWIQKIVQHRLAPNLLMVVLLMAGVWAAINIHAQLNPKQTWNQATVNVSWPGAAAEDVELLVTTPIEYQLQTIPGLENMRSSTYNGGTWISLRFDRNTDITDAVDEVKARVGQVRGLPPQIEPPRIQVGRWYETVASIFISGPESFAELAPFAKQIESELRRSGIDVVELRGFPREEIAIEIDGLTLVEMNASLSDIARSVANLSSDVPAGAIGVGQGQRQIRSLEQQRSAQGFAQMPISVGANDQLTQLGHIASIERRAVDNQRIKMIDGKPAIEIRLRRTDSMDTFDAADILKQWQAANTQKLEAQGIEVQVFLEAWKFAEETLSLVFWNGVSGLVLVLAMLFLFLNLRVALWVAVGIPVSFAGALLIFYYLGGTINLISMIGLVMALGIVVDDAIVVGEHSLYQFEQGKGPEEAAVTGAQRMLGPITASSLTTLAAFIPLLVVDSDAIVEIPLLMLCVILVSLIECFLIMPGHLKHSFSKMNPSRPPARWRQTFDKGFIKFRDRFVIGLLKKCLKQRLATVVAATSCFILAISLVALQHVKFDMNLNIDFEFAEANIKFTPDASDADRLEYLAMLERTLKETDEHFGGNNIIANWSEINGATINNDYQRGPSFANFQVELTSPESRTVTLAQFLSHWESTIVPSPLIEQLQLEQGDQPWPEIEVQFSGAETAVLKEAANELAGIMGTIPGVNNIHDNLPYGRDQWVFTLTPEGRSIGLTSAQVGSQVRSAFEGYRVQLFTLDDREIEVRVSLPRIERARLSSLSKLPIVSPSGEVLPLATVATITNRRGIDSISHVDGTQTVSVRAYPDKSITTADAVISKLEESALPMLEEKYGVVSGKGFWAGAEARMLNQMAVGFLITLALIFIILAWILRSLAWPIAIMTAIPFGFTGALFGLFFMNYNITPMAFLGIFTLTGVIVNDSIILVTCYRDLREQGLNADDALEGCVKQRLRPVVLTSLTTGLGLAPMMLETSLMGATFIPLATVICFGMLYGTILILLVIPAILSGLDSISSRLKNLKQRTQELKRADAQGTLS